MEPVKELLNSWGIISPPEFFSGIGVCILVALLAVSAAFRLFFIRGYEKEEPGWKHWFRGVLGCCCCCAGLVMTFTIPLFYTPADVPDAALAVMMAGVIVAAPGLLLLLASVLPNIKVLLKPGGGAEKQWARKFIYILPLSVLFPLFLRLYQMSGVH